MKKNLYLVSKVLYSLHIKQLLSKKSRKVYIPVFIKLEIVLKTLTAFKMMTYSALLLILFISNKATFYGFELTAILKQNKSFFYIKFKKFYELLSCDVFPVENVLQLFLLNEQ